MAKALIIGAVVVVLIVGGLAFVFWRMMGAPLYKPGMVKAENGLRGPLSPPKQTGGGDRWQMEPGIELHHFAEGTGRNVLVVHGGPGYAFAAPLAGLSRLSDRFRFVYYDQRGGGRSTRPIDAFESKNFYANMTEVNAALGLAAHIADIERIRRILGDEKIILLGHSFGGFIASLYAAEFPEHVEGIVLSAPADLLLFPQTGSDLFAIIREKLPSTKHEEFDNWQHEYLDFKNVFSKSESDLQKLNQRFGVYFMIAAGMSEAPTESWSEPFAPPGWVVQAIYLSMGMRHDYRSAVQAVEVPVLVVHGGRDLVPADGARHYAEIFPNAEFESIPEGAHFMMNDQPEQFAAVVGPFLDRVAGKEGT